MNENVFEPCGLLTTFINIVLSRRAPKHPNVATIIRIHPTATRSAGGDRKFSYIKVLKSPKIV